MIIFAAETNSLFHRWMMAIVPRIVAAASLDATPFLYGIRHDAELRAGLTVTSTAAEALRLYEAREADYALLPSSHYPALTDTVVVTEYCIGSHGRSGSALLVGECAPRDARRILYDPASPTTAQLAAYLYKRHWRTAPEFAPRTALPSPGALDATTLCLLSDEEALLHGPSYAQQCDLGGEWTATTHQPFAYALWVGRREHDAERTEQLQQALTYGLEHTYEALLEGGFLTRGYDAYGHLAREIDYIYDNQKHQALRKFWDSGIKVAPRVNPG